MNLKLLKPTTRKYRGWVEVTDINAIIQINDIVVRHNLNPAKVRVSPIRTDWINFQVPAYTLGLSYHNGECALGTVMRTICPRRPSKNGVRMVRIKGRVWRPTPLPNPFYSRPLPLP